jgi:transposase
LRRYFFKVHHEDVDEETIRQHLHTINAHYVKGQLTYKEADTGAQIDFAKSVYQLTTEGDFERVIFLDEMFVSTSAHKGYGWTTQERLLITARNPTMNGQAVSLQWRLWLPPYSPDLNPQELVWCHDRRKFLNNQEFANGKQLESPSSDFANKIG